MQPDLFFDQIGYWWLWTCSETLVGLVLSPMAMSRWSTALQTHHLITCKFSLYIYFHISFALHQNARHESYNLGLIHSFVFIWDSIGVHNNNRHQWVIHFSCVQCKRANGVPAAAASFPYETCAACKPRVSSLVCIVLTMTTALAAVICTICRHLVQLELIILVSMNFAKM